MPGPLSTYGYINARIRTRISLLLDEDQLRRLENTSSMESLISMLSETEYAEAATVYANTGDPGLCELVIGDQEYRVYEDVLRKITGPAKILVTALARRFEFENIKAALRIWFEKHIRDIPNEAKLPHISPRPWPKGIDFDRFSGANTLEEIVDLIGSAVFSQDSAPIELPTPESIRRKGTVFYLENALDRRYFSILHDAVQQQSKRDRAVAQRIVGLLADVENLRRFARTKSFYDLDQEDIRELMIDIPSSRISVSSIVDDSFESIMAHRFPEIGSLLTGKQSILSQVDLIETVLEEELVREVRKILGGDPFTVGIILSYFVLKNLETQKLMGVLNAKRYGQFMPETIQ